MSSMRLEMQQKLSMELRMAPHIIQSIEVLTLPTLELQNFIQQQLEMNPVLEGGDPPEDGEMSQEDSPETPAEQDGTDDDFLNDFGKLEQEDWAEYYSRNSIPKRNDGEKDVKMEAMQNTPDKPASLQNNLFEQFQLIDIQEPMKKFGEYLIYNIDDKGYLRYPLDEIVKSIEIPVSMEEAEETLRYVQKLEPVGVGARNIQECLLLQLDPDDSDYFFKKELIEKYLMDIYNNRYPKIAKVMGKSLDEIKKAVEAIQKLNPKPGANYSRESTQFIIPDVVVELIEDEYVVRLERDYVPYLKINPMYIRSLKNSDGKFSRKTKEFIKKKIESANWVMDAIKQRQNTLHRVTDKIVQYQQNFLDHGLTRLKPLKMQDVSDELNIHVSTVSRAISDKYIQTPRGIFPLKFFFTGGIDKKDGANESRVTVQERIHDIIIQEDKKHPLSDEEIASKLKDAGLGIARRTVTKYRKSMEIPSSRRRKQY